MQFKKVELVEFEESDVVFRIHDCECKDDKVSLCFKVVLCGVVELTCLTDQYFNYEVVDGELIDTTEMLDYEIELCYDWVARTTFDNIVDYVIYKHGEYIEGYIKDSINDYKDEKQLHEDPYAYYGVKRSDFY